MINSKQTNTKWMINNSQIEKIATDLGLKIHKEFIFWGPAVAIENVSTHTTLRLPIWIEFVTQEEKVKPCLRATETSGFDWNITPLKNQILRELGITEENCI